MNYEVATLANDDGVELIKISELSFPIQNQKLLDSSNPNVKRIVNLASDLLKGAISTPNKTLEIVFRSDIQKGLDSGIYRLMTTKEGEVLVDAIKISTNNIVGKGRVVEAGQTKQLVGGVFQLVSIAVAQAHLSDINHNLNKINLSLDKILEKMESSARSEIRGAIAYLNELVEFMKHQDIPDNLPSAKRMKIEDINYDFKKWRETIFFEMKSVLNNIDNQKDVDRFGTGETYLALKQHAKDTKILNDRYELLLILANMFNIIASYLDPQNRQFSRVDPQVSVWRDMVKNMEESSKKKVSTLLKSARFNQEETLDLRRRDIISEVEKQVMFSSIQEKDYQDRSIQFHNTMRQLINDKGELRLAITFNSSGIAEAVSLSN